MLSPESGTDSTSWWTGLVPHALPFMIFGVVDGLLSSIGPAGANGWQAIPLSVMLWLTLGLCICLFWGLSCRLAFGKDGPTRIQAWIKNRWTLWRDDKGTPADKQRLMVLVGWLAGIGVFLALSFLSLRYLLIHRHGPTLIAITFLVLQSSILVVSIVVGSGLTRGLGWVFRKRQTPSLLTAIKGLASLVGLGTITATALFWRTFIAVDGIAIALLLAACAGAPFLAKWKPSRVQTRTSPLLFLALALGAVLGFAQIDSMNRGAVHSYGAKYILSTLQALSDFDGDGSPVFPVALDCAPFDKTRHPGVREIPGNGIDENCDGADTIQGAYTPKRTPASPGNLKGANLLLVTIDTVRADHLGYMGYQRPTSPHLDAFAKKSTVFTHGYSQDSGTGPSLWSLMTGKTPFQVTLQDAHLFPPQLGPKERTLAERLKKKGYQTAGILCAYVFGPQKKPKKEWNINRGFDSFDEVCGRRGPRGGQLARQTTQRAIAKLKQLKATGKPYFLWVHYYDPHGPYIDHKDFNFGTRPIDIYDEELAYTDRELKPLLDLATTMPSPPVIAITADHGENFGTHGNAPHARNLYREVTHVPLIFFAPGRAHQTIDAPVAVGDINPTFLEFAGIARDPGITMVSQAAVILGAKPDPTRLVFQENSFSRPKRHVKAVVSQSHHLIWDTTNNTYELYAIRKDPEEKTNLFGKGLEIESRLTPILRHFASTTHVPPNLAK